MIMSKTSTLKVVCTKMDIEQARTFLAIAAHGSFLEASRRLHVTHSTVSVRIQKLEEEFGAQLFVRNRSGASLTPSGRRFVQHAKTLVLTIEQARHDVGLPSRFRASVRIGDVVKVFVTPQLSRFLPVHQLPLIIIGAHVAQI